MEPIRLNAQRNPTKSCTKIQSATTIYPSGRFKLPCTRSIMMVSQPLQSPSQTNTLWMSEARSQTRSIGPGKLFDRNTIKRNNVLMGDIWFCAHCVCVCINIYIYIIFYKNVFYSFNLIQAYFCLHHLHSYTEDIHDIYRYLWYLCAACIVHIQRPIATNHEDPGVALCRTWYEVGFHRLWADIFA